MNITLSADKQLVEKSRKYAREHNTSLNNLVREYLSRICGNQDGADSAEEFMTLANTMSGQSPEGYKFDRESIYDRTDNP